MNISVVVPISAGDKKWKELLPDLHCLGEKDEIVISSPDNLEPEALTLAVESKLACKLVVIKSKQGRACQLNQGASVASNEILWFLHCDSRIELDAANILRSKVTNESTALYYFDLAFDNDGPVFLKVNSLGVWLRSHFLKLPFGDQGFGMSKNIFEKLGGFCEQTSYGEDHLFIWKAHKQHISVKYVGSRLITSARKYQVNGWARTTTNHVWLTFRQAVPQALELLSGRSFK